MTPSLLGFCRFDSRSEIAEVSQLLLLSPLSKLGQLLLRSLFDSHLGQTVLFNFPSKCLQKVLRFDSQHVPVSQTV